MTATFISMRGPHAHGNSPEGHFIPAKAGIHPFLQWARASLPAFLSLRQTAYLPTVFPFSLATISRRTRKARSQPARSTSRCVTIRIRFES